MPPIGMLSPLDELLHRGGAPQPCSLALSSRSAMAPQLELRWTFIIRFVDVVGPAEDPTLQPVYFIGELAGRFGHSGRKSNYPEDTAMDMQEAVLERKAPEEFVGKEAKRQSLDSRYNLAVDTVSTTIIVNSDT